MNRSDRLIVVLGYSDRTNVGLHPVCARRLRHAAAIATERDVVVLSGFSRVAGRPPEAALMAQAWEGEAGELVVDPDARTTLGNATNALDDVRRTGASEVVVVTSRWHAARARSVFAWRLRRTRARIRSSSPPEPITPRRSLSEIPRWLILPIQVASAPRG